MQSIMLLFNFLLFFSISFFFNKTRWQWYYLYITINAIGNILYFYVSDATVIRYCDNKYKRSVKGFTLIQIKQNLSLSRFFTFSLFLSRSFISFNISTYRTFNLFITFTSFYVWTHLKRPPFHQYFDIFNDTIIFGFNEK